jgi:hypothetical protein
MITEGTYILDRTEEQKAAALALASNAFRQGTILSDSLIVPPVTIALSAILVKVTIEDKNNAPDRSE